ncbi:hypothetical protein HanIR_Chr03g0104891 [Helianthus annuus]|nr:hypothetical protein HanIR_Chr03g0104891 [Helianthus annuus]
MSLTTDITCIIVITNVIGSFWSCRLFYLWTTSHTSTHYLIEIDNLIYFLLS